MDTHTTVLMNTGKSAYCGIIFDVDMSGQGSRVGKYVSLPHVTVVSDVHTGHQQIHASHGGPAAPTLGTPIDGDELPNDVEITDGQKSLFALILEILGDGSDGGLTDDSVSLTDDRRSLDHGWKLYG